VPTVRANDIELYYERWGDGPRLLFLNGSGATLETSKPLIQLFTDGFDVVAHDQRGLGRSAIPPGPYSMADYAADAAALLDHLGWSPVRVVGVSFGGMVAQELAVTWPERVERLALLCTSPGGAGGASYPLHELAELPPEERAAAGVRLLDTRFTPEWLATHAGDRGLAEMMAARHREGATTVEAQRGAAAQLEARRHHDVWERLPAISCPTLVASGRYDGIAPPANGQAIASRIPGAEWREYEGGHAFFVQDPAALPGVIGFLRGS
jgi:3-oxoadipate enol-lactonase